jgi:hypothetical protein
VIQLLDEFRLPNTSLAPKDDELWANTISRLLPKLRKLIKVPLALCPDQLHACPSGMLGLACFLGNPPLVRSVWITIGPSIRKAKFLLPLSTHEDVEAQSDLDSVAKAFGEKVQ